jgi:hypothetical protein
MKKDKCEMFDLVYHPIFVGVESFKEHLHLQVLHWVRNSLLHAAKERVLTSTDQPM